MFYHPTWNVDELIDVLQSYDVARVLDAWGQWSTNFWFPSGSRIVSQDMRVPILVHALRDHRREYPVRSLRGRCP